MQSLTESPGLPVVGELRYGDVQFEELLKSKIVGRPEWDRARRSVKYIKYVLEVDGYVITNKSAPNDDTWSKMRYTLQQPGLVLKYTDRGFGNFTVNGGNNGLVDVCNGPKPELLEFTPLGARLAARIIWKCEICVPEIKRGGRTVTGSTGSYQTPFTRGILAFNWSTDLSFGDDGYASYVVEGEMEIARVYGVPDNIEMYRAYTEPQLPAGFKPTRRVFRVDDAKQKIAFSYAYAELPPMGLPVKCTKAGGSYNVSSTGNVAAVQWSATLSASYTVVPTGPRREAYMRFLGLLLDRIRHVDTNAIPVVSLGGTSTATNLVGAALLFASGNTSGAALAAVSPPTQPTVGVNVAVNAQGQVVGVAGRKGNVIIRKFTINEGLYEDSKVSSFECNWTFCTTFPSIFAASGAWRPMADCAGQVNAAGQDVWVAEMASIVGYTSWYNYGFRPQAEVVISPNSAAIGPVGPANKVGRVGATFGSDDIRTCTAGAGLVREGVDPDTGASPDAQVRLTGLFPPESSWLNYHIEFITELDPGVALHKPLPQKDDTVDSLGSVNIFSQNPEFNTLDSVNTISKSSSEDILQRMATSTYRVCVRGFGVRAGYKVPVPDLKVFGGVPVSPGKHKVIGPRIVANYSGIPIYLTAWELWYDVPTPPKAKQPTPPNLAQHIGDVANPPRQIPVPVSVPEPPIATSGRLPFQPIVPVQ